LSHLLSKQYGTSVGHATLAILCLNLEPNLLLLLGLPVWLSILSAHPHFWMVSSASRVWLSQLSKPKLPASVFPGLIYNVKHFRFIHISRRHSSPGESDHTILSRICYCCSTCYRDISTIIPSTLLDGTSRQASLLTPPLETKAVHTDSQG